MKARTIKLIIAVLLTGQLLFAQGWEQTFDIEPQVDDVGEKILIADNGDYLISGEHMTGSHFPYVFVSRVSPDGDEIWSKSYFNPNPLPASGNGEPYLFNGGMTKASDGGYIVAATAYFGLPYRMIVMKIDETNGDTIWTKNHIMPDSLNLWELHDIETVSDGGYIAIGYTSQGDVNVVTIKINTIGELEWVKQMYHGFSGQPHTIIATSDDNFVISGVRIDTLTLNRSYYLQKIDLNGGEIWIKDYDITLFTGYTGTDVKETPDGGFIIAAAKDIIKTDSEGNIEWSNQNIPDILESVVLTSDGGYVFAGRFIKSQFDNDLMLLKTNSNGDILWFKLYGGTGNDYGQDVIETTDGSLIAVGTNDFFTGTLFIVKTNSGGNLYDNVAKGRVFWDENNSCEDDLGELGFEMHLVQIIGTDTLYAFTNPNGEYEIGLDTGSYTIRPILPNPYWETCIDNPFPFEISNAPDTSNIDLPAQAAINCPYLEIDISTPFLRRCFDNIYHVNYCNSGTTIAEDAVVKVILDPYLEYQSSSIDLSAQYGDTLEFEIGDIGVYDCGTFDITTFLSCDSTILGQSHCVTALISPDSICLPGNPLWSGASLEVDAQCTSDSIFFYIENIGINDMFAPRNFIVTEDVIMFDEGQVQLMSGEAAQVFAMESNGATWRLEVDQVEGHPGSSNPSVVVEGCIPFGNPFSQYFINIFPQDDGNPFVSIDCQENVGSFDPNDKQGFPVGWSDEHFIERNEDLEYMIRFQNTGTDTAFTVVIEDIISPHLDMATFRRGVSSHPYRMEFNNPNKLTFIFDNILLPDSTTNEVASHGFVKFKISQMRDLPLGTVIYNHAGIFFDFNEAVVTNETFHTVTEPLITLTFEPSIPENILISAYPNPFKESTTIEVEGANHKNLNLQLFDTKGRLISSEKAENEQFILHRKGLTTGIYFYKIEGTGQLIGAGKLIVQ